MAALSLGLRAQTPAPESIGTLQQNAEKKLADWDALARGLESKLARMLPCDPRVRGAIEEVRNANDTRIAAFSRYLQAAAEQTRTAAQAVERSAAGETSIIDDIRTELAEAQQERIAIDAQIADLNESAKARASLQDASKALAEVAGMVSQRAADTQPQATRRAALTAALRDLTAAFQGRETAIQAEISQLSIEASRWSDYYAARLARAQTECSITNPQRAPRQRKQ